MEQLVDIVASLTEVTADGACNEILASVNEHTRGEPLHDDATLLVVERLSDKSC